MQEVSSAPQSHCVGVQCPGSALQLPGRPGHDTNEWLANKNSFSLWYPLGSLHSLD